MNTLIKKLTEKYKEITDEISAKKSQISFCNDEIRNYGKITHADFLELEDRIEKLEREIEKLTCKAEGILLSRNIADHEMTIKE